MTFDAQLTAGGINGYTDGPSGTVTGLISAAGSTGLG